MKATSRQMRDRSGRGAFTLLEMLTVVVIVGLLLVMCIGFFFVGLLATLMNAGS